MAGRSQPELCQVSHRVLSEVSERELWEVSEREVLCGKRLGGTGLEHTSTYTGLDHRYVSIYRSRSYIRVHIIHTCA